MERVAVFHIGSNTTKMVVYEINSSGCYRMLREQREMIRLYNLVGNTFHLENDPLGELILVLNAFKNFAELLKVDSIMTITNISINNIDNNVEIIKHIREKTGLDVITLSGIEKAYYDGLAAISSLDIKNSLVVDIGGNYTEFIYVNNNSIVDTYSVRMGAVNLSHTFSLTNIITKSNIDSASSFIIETMKSIPWLYENKYDNIILIGSSIKNICDIDKCLRRYALDIFHNYEMNLSELSNILNILKSKNLLTRRKVQGLAYNRADIIVAPTLLIQTIMKELSINDILVCSKGVRDGLLYEYIDNHHNKYVSSPLDQSLRNLMFYNNIDVPHANRVHSLFKKLFLNLKSELHLSNQNFDKIIKVSSMLLDSGVRIKFFNHNKHTFYLIINSEINELSHKELILSAYTTCINANNTFDTNSMQYLSIVSKLDLQNATKLGVLLRISSALDSMYNGNVEDIDLSISENNCTLRVISHKDCEYEKRLVRKMAFAFNELLDMNLIVE